MRQLLWLVTMALAGCSADSHTPVVDTKAASASPSVAPDSTVATPTAFDSATVKNLSLNHMPAELPSLPGNVLALKQWIDGNGANLLVVARTPVRTLPAGPNNSDNTKSVNLYVRQYVQRPSGWQELWRLQDAVEQCAFDTWLGLVPGTTTITDLDADGQTETTLLYRLSCRSDVSPAAQKLVMREGAAKYALRGHSVVQYDSVPATQRIPASACCLDTIRPARLEKYYELLAGRYENEREFRAAPPAFLRFARQQWRRWSVEEQFEQL